MPAFKDIVGHEQIIEHLQNAITMDKVSHAYILKRTGQIRKNDDRRSICTDAAV